MKLMKKLLPLVTLGATACTIAPVLTACNNGGGEKKEEVTVYTIKFDANGGSKVADQKAVKGELIHEPTVEKTGCALIGWKNGSNYWDFDSDKATKDMTLTAEWYEIPESQDTDLLTFDYSKLAQHDETTISTKGEAAYKEAGKMYFGDKTEKSPKIEDRIKNDILVQLSLEAQTLEVAEVIDPGCIEGFNFVGQIISAYADVQATKVEMKTDDNQYAYITGTIDLTLNAKLIDETSKQQIGYYALRTSHTLNKVPYHITDWNESDHYWDCKTDVETLNKFSNGWTIDRTYYGAAIYYSGEVEDETDTQNWSLTNMPKKDNLDPITWSSYYMDTVAHGE